MTQILMNEPPLLLLPQLACQIGVYESMVLQQVHYWLNPRFNKHCFEGKLWVYNTLKQWHTQFPFFSEKTLRRTFENLESQNLLIVGYFNKTGWNRTKWYSLNYEVLASFTNSSENPGDNSFAPNEGASAHSGISLLPVPTFMWSAWAHESGQNGPLEMVKVGTSYIDAEITTENTTEKGIQEKPQSDQKGNQENFELVF